MTRLYQWLNQGMNLPTLDHVADAPGGECIVQCPCGHEFNTKNVENCPQCGTDLVYPRCDW